MICCDRDGGGLFHKSCVRYDEVDEMESGRENWYCVACDSLLSDSEYVPLRELEDEGLQRAPATQIEALPEREKLVMALYYDQGLNLKEIGEVLEVSESRVCQIHSQAVLRLKGRLGDWLAA